VDSNSPSEPLSNRQRKAQASSIPDRFDLAGQVMFSLFHESLGHGADGADVPVEPEGRVDAVGQQVAGDARAGRRHVQPPERGAALGKVRRDRPVLEEVGPVVEDPAQPALVDQHLGERHGGHPAIVVPDHIRDAGLLHRIDHLLAFDQVHRQGLLAEHHLARLGRGDGDLGMSIVGRANVDNLDIFPLDQLPPVGLYRLVAPLLGE